MGKYGPFTGVEKHRDRSDGHGIKQEVVIWSADIGVGVDCRGVSDYSHAIKLTIRGLKVLLRDTDAVKDAMYRDIVVQEFLKQLGFDWETGRSSTYKE